MNILNSSVTSQLLQIGSQPIAWSNDDFLDLGAEISLEQCLSEMAQAGYQGTELGHKFPKDPRFLKSILSRYSLRLVSGWHSSYLLSEDYEVEKKRFLAHLEFLAAMHCSVVIIAECTYRTYHQGGTPLSFQADKIQLSDSQWQFLSQRLNQFGELAKEFGLKLVYHHHMGTVIQSLQEICILMRSTAKDLVYLLADTGHLVCAGINPEEVVGEFENRIGHVHLKNIRPSVLQKAKTQRMSFEQAVREGIFTVPGDGGIDFFPIIQKLLQVGYQGWWIVEAEQDPTLAQPLKYAQMGRQYLNSLPSYLV